MIANDLGERTTPCMVGYDGEEVVSAGLLLSEIQYDFFLEKGFICDTFPPSFSSFHLQNIGLTALQGVVRNGKNTGSKFYDLIGRKFADPAVQNGT